MQVFEGTSTELNSSSALPVFTGTSSELMQQAITLNGELIDSVGFSILLRYGMIEVIGEKAKEQFSRKRGRIPKIFRLVSREGLVFGKIAEEIQE